MVIGDTFLNRRGSLLTPNKILKRFLRMKKSSITFVALIALFTVAATCFCILEKDEKPVTRFWGHQYGGHKVMDSIVFSHDGATLISGDSEKATLWNLAPLRKVRSFQGANATLSRDDKVVATVVDDPST